MSKQNYIKKPIIIEALKWTGKNEREMFDFLTNYNKEKETISLEDDNFRIDLCNGGCQTGNLIIKTLEGEHLANIGDYIIKGIKGEFYPCKPDIFDATYKKVDKNSDIPPVIDRDLEGENEKLRGQLDKAKEVIKWALKNSCQHEEPDETGCILLKAIKEIDELKQEVREC